MNIVALSAFSSILVKIILNAAREVTVPSLVRFTVRYSNLRTKTISIQFVSLFAHLAKSFKR